MLAEGQMLNFRLTCWLLLNKWLHHNNYIKRDGDMVNDVHYLHWFLLESDINVVITIMVAININIGNIMRLWSEPSLSGDSIIRYQCCLSLFSILRNVDNVMKDKKSRLLITHASYEIIELFRDLVSFITFSVPTLFI